MSVQTESSKVRYRTLVGVDVHPADCDHPGLETVDTAVGPIERCRVCRVLRHAIPPADRPGPPHGPDGAADREVTDRA